MGFEGGGEVERGGEVALAGGTLAEVASCHFFIAGSPESIARARCLGYLGCCVTYKLLNGEDTVTVFSYLLP